MRTEQIFLLLFFIIIGANFDTGISYAIFGIIVCLFLITRKKILLKIKAWDFVALGFLALWLYGLGLGIYLDNKVEYIIANNAAMLLYLIYYILLQINISKEKIFNLLIISSWSIAGITFIIFLLNLVGAPQGIAELFGKATGGSSTGQRRVYFVSQIALYPALAFFMGAYISSSVQKSDYFKIYNFKQKLYVFIAFSIYTICVAFFTASKGFMLGYIFLLFILPISLFYKGMSKGFINKKIFFFLALIVVLFLSLLMFGYLNIITSTFDDKDLANLARYEQLYYLLNDLTFWGKGLGSVIPGYSRNLDKPYGFELSYLSLIHKFGVLGLFAVMLYIIIICKAIRNIISGNEVKYAITSIGCITYLLPSIGNPLLFAPQAVVLNSLAIYLLRKKND